MIGKYPQGTAAAPSCSGGNEQENRSSLDFYTGIFGVDKTRIMEIVNGAVEEVVKMGTMGEPLWVRSLETDREILNYDEYVKEFGNNKVVENSSTNTTTSSRSMKRLSIEASRDTGLVFVDLPRLLQRFLDVVSNFQSRVTRTHNDELLYILPLLVLDFPSLCREREGVRYI